MIDNLVDVINNIIENDPALQYELLNIKCSVVVIDITGIDVDIWFQVHNGKVSIPEKLPEYYTKISASPFTFLAAISNVSNTNSFPPGVNINGDVSIVTKLMKIFNKTNIDWEQYLSTKIGDVAASVVFGGISFGYKVRKKFCESSEENVKDFLQDEVNLIPNRNEFREFQNDIAFLRDAVERLEVKVKHLE